MSTLKKLILCISKISLISVAGAGWDVSYQHCAECVWLGLEAAVRYSCPPVLPKGAPYPLLSAPQLQIKGCLLYRNAVGLITEISVLTVSECIFPID